MKQVLILLYAILFGYLANKHYFISDGTFWVSLVLVPYLIWALPLGKISHRFALPTLFFLVAAFFISTYSVRFLLLVCAILWVAESLWGHLSSLFLVVLLLLSPLFRLVSESFTFPIRLQLSEWTGFLLSKIGLPVVVSGNVIQLQGVDYVVEPACVGLQSTGLSLLLVVFLMAHKQHQSGKKYTEITQIGLLGIAFLLNIGSNLCRMTAIVFFKLLPINPLHDAVGLFCLVVYVGLPMAWLVPLVLQKEAKDVNFIWPLTIDHFLK